MFRYFMTDENLLMTFCKSRETTLNAALGFQEFR